MSIAPIKQKLLRIVFWTYMSFRDFQIQKKCFAGAPDNLVNSTKLTRTLPSRIEKCAKLFPMTETLH